MIFQKRILYKALASPILSRLLKLLALPLLPISLYAAFIEPYRLRVRRIRVKALCEELRGLKLAHISDLHLNALDRRYRRAAALLRSLSPDLICITGDSINSADGLGPLHEFLPMLRAPLGVFASCGNHDSPLLGEKEVFEAHGHHFLVDEARAVEFHGVKFWVLGLHFLTTASGALEMLARLPEDAFRIVLAHNPDIYDGLSAAVSVRSGCPYTASAPCLDLDPRPVSSGSSAPGESPAPRPHCLTSRSDCSLDSPVSTLVLSGHTHGGQICLPFYGAVLTASRTGKRFESGLFPAGSFLMNVTTGVGTFFFDARFLCRPEVCLIELI